VDEQTPSTDSHGPSTNEASSTNETPGSGRTYLLFVSKPTGYELKEQQGEPPAVGSEVELDDGRLRVSKLGVSPLPGDMRPCAYLLGN
jgi:hypothetical protein